MKERSPARVREAFCVKRAEYPEKHAAFNDVLRVPRRMNFKILEIIA